MGADAETLEEFGMKYWHPELLNCESLFRFFLDETHPTTLTRREWCFHVSH